LRQSKALPTSAARRNEVTPRKRPDRALVAIARPAFDAIGATLHARCDGSSLALADHMGIILFIVFGLVIGLIARAVLPGRQSMGLVATALLGIAGSFMGGFLVSLVTHNRITDFNTAGVLGSIVGAVVLLLIAGRFSRRGALA
jgi:uncharacterized membrane protein YeaQ/YmgE (transglycosylase-associated protein family)